MTGEFQDLSRSDVLRLMVGDPKLCARVAAGEQLRAETPFRYPGRRGAIVVHLGLRPGTDPADARGATGTERIRISDGGGLIKSLEEQGMDLAVDMVLSKTVFHAVRETKGADIVRGEVCLDSTPEKIAADLWRFMQMMAEIIGLRHAKYKDALLRLSRRQDAPDLIEWGR